MIYFGMPLPQPQSIYTHEQTFEDPNSELRECIEDIAQIRDVSQTTSLINVFLAKFFNSDVTIESSRKSAGIIKNIELKKNSWFSCLQNPKLNQLGTFILFALCLKHAQFTEARPETVTAGQKLNLINSTLARNEFNTFHEHFNNLNEILDIRKLEGCKITEKLPKPYFSINSGSLKFDIPWSAS